MNFLNLLTHKLLLNCIYSVLHTNWKIELVGNGYRVSLIAGSSHLCLKLINNIGVVAKREASQRSELSLLPSVVASVPELEEDVHDLGGVLELGRHIWSWDKSQ